MSDGSSRVVSVVLCTFNGARFLGAQLDSLAAQSRAPDELIVADDGSSDGTVDLVNAFIARASFRVRVLPSLQRLGPARNFARALAAAEGDVILPSDQDDVWTSEKIERVIAPFARTDVRIVCCNASVVTSSLAPTGRDLWSTLRFSAAARDEVRRGRAFDVLIRQPFATGMAMAIRRDAIAAAPPPPDGFLHDEWLALWVAATGGSIELVSSELVLYRQHERNFVGARAGSMLDAVRAAIALPRATYAEVAAKTRRAIDALAGLVPPERVAALAEKARHFEARAALPRGRRSRGRPVLGELTAGRYARYSLGLSSALRDALAPADR